MIPGTAANNYSAKQLVVFSEITRITTGGTNLRKENNGPTSRNLKYDRYYYCTITNKGANHPFGMSTLIATKGTIQTNVIILVMLWMDYKMYFYWTQKTSKCRVNV